MVSAADEDGDTPLAIAAANENVGTLRALVLAGKFAREQLATWLPRCLLRLLSAEAKQC